MVITLQYIVTWDGLHSSPIKYQIRDEDAVRIMMMMMVMMKMMTEFEQLLF